MAAALNITHSVAIPTHYRFTDQEFDAESGLYNYDARLYDPIIGMKEGRSERNLIDKLREALC